MRREQMTLQQKDRPHAWLTVPFMGLVSITALIITTPAAARLITLDAPPVPQNFRTTTTTSSSVGLAWNDVPNEQKYQLLKRNGSTNVDPIRDNTGWELVAELPANTTSHTATPLFSGVTYSFALIAENNDGYTSTPPIIAVTAQADPAPALPAAPSNLKATAQFTSISLTWRDNSNNETGFEVTSLPPVGAAIYQTIARLAPGVTSFTHTELEPGTTHTYKVCAQLNDERNCSTNAVRVTIPEPPPRPNNLSATAASDVPVVQLNWQQGGGPLEYDGPTQGFKILRRDESTDFKLIATVNTSTFSYRDDFLLFPPARSFAYRVEAFNDAGSVFREVLIALPDLVPAPTGVTAQPMGLASIVVKWTPSPGATFHIVQMQRSGRFETVFSADSGGQFVHNNHGEPGNTVVTYRVAAINGGGPSYSANATARTPLELPPKPSGLNGKAISSSVVRLSWRDSSASNNRTGEFVIRRGTTSFNFQTVASGSLESFAASPPMVGSFNFTDSGLEQNSSYVYDVIAKNSSGESQPAGIAVKTISLEPTAPTNLQASASSSSAIVIGWQDTATNETSYSIEELIVATGSYVQVSGAGANETTATHTGLSPSSHHVYRVCAVNNIAKTCSAGTVSATTQPQAAIAAPSGLKIFNVTATSFSITWVDNSSTETGFRIERFVNGVFTSAGTTAANAQTFTVTGLQPNTFCEVRVCTLSAGAVECSTSKTTTTASN